MDEKHLTESITRAVEDHCAHLHADPLLAQKVIRRADRKEPVIVRKKMKYGVALALILMLLTATAVAAVLLTGMEVIEQEAVPMAQGNDGDVRPVDEYTFEELQSIILTAQENGIYLDDDTSVMRALRNGEGYSEEETIMAICREAFGGLFYEWTTEEKHWFQEMMIDIGWSTENGYEIPGEGEMSSAEARAQAVKLLQEKYGADLPLDDPAMYRVEEWYFAKGDDQLGLNWNFVFYPRYLEGATCYASFDKQGGQAELSREEPYTWTEYTELQLKNRVDRIYNYRYAGTGMVSWECDAWYAFGQKLPGAQRSASWNEEYDAYAASVYLLPGEGDLTRQQARDIAFADAGVKDYTGVTELLLGKGSQRTWKITFNTSEKTGKNQLLSYEIDSVSREILRRDDLTSEQAWARYVLFQTYEAFAPDKEDILTPEKAVEIAVKTLHTHFNDDTIPYMDESIYEINARYNANSDRYTVLFNVKQLGYGRANVTVKGDGTARLVFANPSGLNGDTLFECYDDLYGSCFDWDQSRWVEFGQAMQQYEPTTFEGKLFKQTTYVDASTVKISRDDALDIVWKDAQTDHICAILIGAEPNPVWKVRANTNPVTTLYEIDAMTGEILDKELYYIQLSNFDHTMKMYTLRKDYMPAALAHFGVERIAMELCVKAFAGDFEQYGESPDIFTNKSAYSVQVDGMTVTFAARDPQNPSYRVTVAQDAMSAEVENLSHEEAAPIAQAAAAALYAQYGEDIRFWPVEMQFEYFRDSHGYDLPMEGDMPYEEARDHALKLLIAEVGQEAVDALGELKFGTYFARIYQDKVAQRWTFYIASAADTTKGWKVTFAIWDGVPETSADIKDINDMGNG